MPGIGPRTAARALRRFGSAGAVLASSDPVLARALGVDVARLKAMRSGVSRGAVRRDLRSLSSLGGTAVFAGHPKYPLPWRGMDDPPVVVRCLGDLDCLVARPCVSIVGSRRASSVGIDLATRFCRAFIDAGWTVCSGGARGIDAAVHRACLRSGGRTIVVLGSGLSCPYPPEHASLFDDVVESGGLVMSEFPCAAAPRPAHFPVRNRIVAGLSVGVLLVEAGPRSGALITGRLAVEDYGRELLAIPGRADRDTSAGCHRAVREGWAMLVDEPGQALEHLSSQAGLIGLYGLPGRGD